MASVGLKKGKSDEELIAEQFGVKDPSLMSETQKAYKDKVKESLAKVCNLVSSGEETTSKRRFGPCCGPDPPCYFRCFFWEVDKCMSLHRPGAHLECAGG